MPDSGAAVGPLSLPCTNCAARYVDRVGESVNGHTFVLAVCHERLPVGDNSSSGFYIESEACLSDSLTN